MHRPHDGRALSQRFFFLLQLRHTLEDFAAAAACCEGEGAAEDPAADIWGHDERERDGGGENLEGRAGVSFGYQSTGPGGWIYGV